MTSRSPSTWSITGNLVDLDAGEIYPARITVADGIIAAIDRVEGTFSTYLSPGFVDAHVHIESSLLIPTEFARLAVCHGTVATVSDPHEIANVLGVEGVDFMIRNGARTPFKFFFGAPSCVPATTFETAGAHLGPAEVEALLARPEILYLSEMMNFPGVIHQDPEVMAKLDAARRLGKPVDGHAPGLRGEGLAAYAAAGIRNDHECFTLEEAEEKITHGMVIAIREGSAAKNFSALEPLLGTTPEKCLFCTDDMHLDNLLLGHLDRHCARAVAAGHDPLTVLKVATLQTIRHYNLPVGQLRVGDPADFIELSDLRDFQVRKTFLDGELVAENGQTLLPSVEEKPINKFHCAEVAPDDFRIPAGKGEIRVIGAIDHQLVTEKKHFSPKIENGWVVTDPDRDLLKIAVVNRYQPAPPAVALITNFGLREGAIASSVGHDSHNITAVGVTDEALARAVNAVREASGGLAAVNQRGEVKLFPLPVAGLMTHHEAYASVKAYQEVEAMAKGLGCPLSAPFMSLSFMALLVIPALKLSDRGLFDGETFSFVPLFTEEETS